MPLFDEKRIDQAGTGTLYIDQPTVRYKLADNFFSTGITAIEQQQETDIDFIPVVKYVNIGMMGLNSGKSDYQGKEQLFAEIDNRVDQINYILQEHADPWTLLPPGVLNEHGQFIRNQGKMIEKGANTKSDVEIVAWNAQLEAAFQRLKTG